MAHWKAAGIPLDRACDLYRNWVQGFCHAFNPDIVHYKRARMSAGDPFCEEVWELRAGAS